MYCGNNANHISLRRREKIIGNRYDCFRKGVGVGRNLPYDPAFSGNYRPIDERKIYCGKRANLPQGYQILGNNTMCFAKGVGVGRVLVAKQIKNPPRRKSPRFR